MYNNDTNNSQGWNQTPERVWAWCTRGQHYSYQAKLNWDTVCDVCSPSGWPI